jgi:hypothetical protein
MKKYQTLVLIIISINILIFSTGFFLRVMIDASDPLWYLQALEAGLSWLYLFNLLSPRYWLIYVFIYYALYLR